MSSRKRASALIIGFGHLGMYAAKQWSNNIPILGVSRTTPTLSFSPNIHFYKLDLSPNLKLESHFELLKQLHQCDWVNFWLPYNSQKISQDHYIDILNLFLMNMRQDQLFTFTSSTSVFGQNNSVYENTVPDSQHPLVKVESHIKNFHPYCHIIRLAGLVSDSRHPVNFLSQKTQIKSPWTPVNLIHVEDVVRFLLHLKNHPQWGKQAITTNLSSDTHLDRFSYYTSVAKKRGLRPPEFDMQDQTSQQSRIILNDFLWSKYRFKLKHLHVY